MMPAHVHADVLIAGGGQAGATVARSLRELGFAGSITLVCAEPVLPYERPPLSKEILLGTSEPEAIRVLPEQEYQERDIRVLTGVRVDGITPRASSARLDDGRAITYGKLVLATGARLRRLAVPGADLGGVFYLRNIDDSLRLRTALEGGKRLAVIGGGFIGLEVASAARRLGCEVTLLEAGSSLMGRAVVPAVAEYFRALHESQGVRILLGAQLQEILGGEVVKGVALSDGETIFVDAVLAGIGVDAETTLAEQAGLAVDNGILVDEHGRTSVENIYACGDACRMVNPFYGVAIRAETWQNAIDTARAVATTIAGATAPPPGVPWFWSDQAGVNFQMAGIARDYDDILFRGDVQGGRFSVYLLRAGRIVAANTINNGREMRFARQYIASRTLIDRDRLADAAADIRSCATVAAD